MVKLKAFDTAPKVKRAVVVWGGTFAIIAIITALRGIGWDYSETTNTFWYNPVTLAPAYIWEWSGYGWSIQNIAFCGFIVLLWWLFLSFLIMKIVDWCSKSIEW